MSKPDATEDLVAPLWRALVVFRIVTWGYACLLVYLEPDITRIWGAVTLLAAMAAWTAVTTVAYRRDWGRTGWFGVIDLVVSIGCMVGTLLADPLERIQEGQAILTSLWVAGPTLALAIAKGRDGGLAAAGVTSAVLLTLRQRVVAVDLDNVALLVAAGFLVGYAATTTRHAGLRMREALAAQGAMEERERLARSIHDGVLQVLAHVKRRGEALGGEAAELGALAGEQEIALRSLITNRSEGSADGRADLREALSPYAGPRVEIVVPATPVELDGYLVGELSAVVAEALTNVRRHAGPQARAWVVVEDRGDHLVLSIRDDGPGIAPGALERAAADGRLGVAQSIRGRVRDLGGEVTLHSGDGEGTEWEITIHKAVRETPR